MDGSMKQIFLRRGISKLWWTFFFSCWEFFCELKTLKFVLMFGALFWTWRKKLRCAGLPVYRIPSIMVSSKFSSETSFCLTSHPRVKMQVGKWNFDAIAAMQAHPNILRSQGGATGDRWWIWKSSDHGSMGGLYIYIYIPIHEKPSKINHSHR